jgi:hypothetical protein
MRTSEDEIKLWVTTIENVEDMVEAKPVSEVPSIAAKLRDVAEGLRDRFGEFLVCEAMAGRLTGSI